MKDKGRPIRSPVKQQEGRGDGDQSQKPTATPRTGENDDRETTHRPPATATPRIRAAGDKPRAP